MWLYFGCTYLSQTVKSQHFAAGWNTVNKFLFKTTFVYKIVNFLFHLNLLNTKEIGKNKYNLKTVV